MSGNILQLVLVEGPPAQRAVDHNLRLLMFGRPQAASPAFASQVIAYRRPSPSLFFDTFTSVYSVTEAYQQTSAPFGVTFTPSAMLYTRSNRVLEDEWPYPKTNHALLNQFRWTQIGLIRGYTFDVPDLNDYPWLEWPVQRADRGAGMFPFRQLLQPAPAYQWPTLFWGSKDFYVEAEADKLRQTDYSLGPMLFFGKPQISGNTTVPNVVGLFYVTAETVLTGVGLGYSVSFTYSNTVPNGIVISQAPVGGTIEPLGFIVALVASLGPPVPVLVPNFVGARVSEAEALAGSLGLILAESIDPFYLLANDGEVIWQSVPEGEYVLAGSIIMVKVAPFIPGVKVFNFSVPNTGGSGGPP